jgi:hypothetical protein
MSTPTSGLNFERTILNNIFYGIKWEYIDTVHQLFTGFKTAYDSVRRELLYNILLEFGVPIELNTLIKTCLNETCSKVHAGKHFSNSFPIQNDLK